MVLTIREIVVDSVILRRQLREEQPRQIRDPLIRILDTLRHFAQLTLNLDHSIQNQMRQHHERVLLDNNVFIRQPSVQLAAVLIDDCAERNSHVSERDDDVASDARVLRRLEDPEEQVVVFVAELGAHAEEFAERQCSRSAEGSILMAQLIQLLRRISRTVRTLYFPGLPHICMSIGPKTMSSECSP